MAAEPLIPGTTVCRVRRGGDVGYDSQVERQWRSLQELPGVGPSIEGDLQSMGIESVNDLRGKNPEELYSVLRDRAGGALDRCVLYVIRCAVYWARFEGPKPDPELKKWWAFMEGGPGHSALRMMAGNGGAESGK